MAIRQQLPSLAESLSVTTLQSSAFLLPVLSGNTIIVCAGLNSSFGAFSTCTDNAGNGNYAVDQTAVGAPSYARIYRLNNAIGGSNFRITVNATQTSMMGFTAFELDALVSPYLDQAANNFLGTTTTPTTGTTGTLLASQELAFALLVLGSLGRTFTEPAGWTSQAQQTSGTRLNFDVATLETSSTAALNPQWTIAPASGFAAVICTYLTTIPAPSRFWNPPAREVQWVKRPRK